MSELLSRGLGAPLWFEVENVALNLPQSHPREGVGLPSLKHSKFNRTKP